MSGELACSYAALILHDAGKKVDEASIKKVVEAANVKTEPYWPMLYASILTDKDAIEEIIFKPGGGGSGGSGPATSGDGAEEKEEEKEEEEEEEEEVAMGNLMGGDDDGW
jgi:large subunit ribosomal protein LP1